MFREYIHFPGMVAHEEFSRRLRVTFKLFRSLKTLDFMWGDFYIEIDRSLRNHLQQINSIKYCWIT